MQGVNTFCSHCNCEQYVVKLIFSSNVMNISYLTKTANICTFHIFDSPWDFSIKDTSEELRLIVHMWIGLFYSRSTARFFHVDSNFTYPCSEENNLLETEMTSDPAQSELRTTSFAPFPNVTDSSLSQALDLSKKDISSLAQGVGILDLSLRNSNVDTDSSTSQVNRKKLPVSSKKKDASETVNTLMSLMGLHEASTFQVGYNVTITLKITYYLVYLMFLSCYSNGLSGVK